MVDNGTQTKDRALYTLAYDPCTHESRTHHRQKVISHISGAHTEMVPGNESLSAIQPNNPVGRKTMEDNGAHTETRAHYTSGNDLCTRESRSPTTDKSH